MKTKKTILTSYGFLLAFCWQIALKAQLDVETGLSKQTYSCADFTGSNSEAEADYYMYRNDLGEPIPETLPATQDIHGNWGVAIKGLQLSLRFRQHEFLTNQPVQALLIFRNLESSSNFSVVIPEPEDYEYFLYHGTNVIEWEKSKRNPEAGITDMYRKSCLGATSQALAVMNLRQIFDLNDLGDYSLKVQIKIGKRNQTNIVSGVASFEIVDKLSTEEIASLNQQAKYFKGLEQRYNKLLHSNLPSPN